MSLTMVMPAFAADETPQAKSKPKRRTFDNWWPAWKKSDMDKSNLLHRKKKALRKRGTGNEKRGKGIRTESIYLWRYYYYIVFDLLFARTLNVYWSKMPGHEPGILLNKLYYKKYIKQFENAKFLCHPWFSRCRTFMKTLLVYYTFDFPT